MASGRQQKRQQVIEAARTVLEQHGIRKLTLEDVAAKAGLAISSLYYYFSSKNELLQAVAELGREEGLADIEAAVAAAGGPEQQLAAVGRTLLLHMRRISELPGITHRERQAAYAEVERAAQRFKVRIRLLIQSILERGVEQGLFAIDDPELVALMFAAGLRGLSDMILNGEFPADRMEALEKLMVLSLDGLRRR